MSEWHCYFHEGPCKLLDQKDGVQFEQHGNSRYRWWEVYDRNNFKIENFKRKVEAREYFLKLVSVEEKTP